MNIGSILKHVVRSGDRGQIIPLVAVALVVLLGAAALAVDTGYWRYQQRLEQSAADSAAIAGAGELNFPTPNAQTAATKGAKQDSALNGFTDGAANTTVLVNYPPSTGAYQGNAGAVEVIVSKTQPTFFANVFGFTGQVVQARAVAFLSSANSGCVYVMKGGISGDLTLHGGGQGGITSSPLCGIVVNGDLTVTGQANVDASFISYVGSGPGGGSYPHGAPVKSVAATDPCTRLPGCLYLMNLTPAQLSSATCQDPGGVLPAMPLPPGRYCNGPYSTSPVTLQQGLFIMDKGMFTGAAVSGTGVTIYNNCQSSCDLTLSGGNVNNSIVAPLTGPTAGMAYFQPASLTNNITVNGASGAVTYTGGVYAPGATFTFNGQLPTISFLVAGSITMNGGGLNVGGPPSGGPPVPTNAVLVE